MDPATAAVMLLLSCTPDTLLCRKLPRQAGTFESLARCETMLPAEIERRGDGKRRIIGRCEALARSSSQWAKLPDSTVATALQQDERLPQQIPSPPKTDQVMAGSTGELTIRSTESVLDPFRAAEEPEQTDLAVVRVTRMVSGAAVTTAYIVGKN